MIRWLATSSFSYYLKIAERSSLSTMPETKRPIG